jgi:hypothetical protein
VRIISKGDTVQVMKNLKMEIESVGAWERGRVGEWVNRGESGARGERGCVRESQTDEINRQKGRAKDHPRLAHMLDVEPSADAIYPTPR